MEQVYSAVVICVCVFNCSHPSSDPPLHVPVVKGGGAGGRENDSLLPSLSLPPKHETLQVRALGFSCFGDQASMSVVTTCPDAKTVLLWGQKFWKPIKMCLLWVRTRASGCRPLSGRGAPSLLLST